MEDVASVNKIFNWRERERERERENAKAIEISWRTAIQTVYI